MNNKESPFSHFWFRPVSVEIISPYEGISYLLQVVDNGKSGFDLGTRTAFFRSSLDAFKFLNDFDLLLGFAQIVYHYHSGRQLILCPGFDSLYVSCPRKYLVKKYV